MVTNRTNEEEDDSNGVRSAVVVGAGIAGVSTAFYLAQRGYRVTCVEKREEVAREASFLNGGLVCPSLTLPWPCFEGGGTAHYNEEIMFELIMLRGAIFNELPLLWKLCLVFDTCLSTFALYS